MDDAYGRSSGVVADGEEKGEKRDGLHGCKRKRFGASCEVAVMMFRGRAKEKNTNFWGRLTPHGPCATLIFGTELDNIAGEVFPAYMHHGVCSLLIYWRLTAKVRLLLVCFRSERNKNAVPFSCAAGIQSLNNEKLEQNKCPIWS